MLSKEEALELTARIERKCAAEVDMSWVGAQPVEDRTAIEAELLLATQHLLVYIKQLTAEN